MTKSHPNITQTSHTQLKSIHIFTHNFRTTILFYTPYIYQQKLGQKTKTMNRQTLSPIHENQKSSTPNINTWQQPSPASYPTRQQYPQAPPNHNGPTLPYATPDANTTPSANRQPPTKITKSTIFIAVKFYKKNHTHNFNKQFIKHTHTHTHISTHMRILITVFGNNRSHCCYCHRWCVFFKTIS